MKEMKDSGIRGLGLIPAYWTTQRIKYLFTFGKGLPITKANLIEKGLPVISYGQIHSKSNNGTEVKKDLLRYVDFEYERLYPSCEVFQYDFVFADTSEDYDGCGNCVYKRDEERLFAGYHDVVLHSIVKKDNRYFAYLFQTDAWRRQVRDTVTGVKVFSITQKTLANAKVIIPSDADQRLISDYLDKKCAEIDELSATILAEIDSLDEYRKSVITEAVTKGINPNVEMTASGVSWCPQIPKHWTMVPSKYLFRNSELRKLPEDVQLTASQKHGIISQQDYMERENAKIVLANHGIEKWKHVEPFDFVISLRSFQGGLEMSQISGCITWHYVVLKPRKPIVSRYYKWLFKSDAYIKALQQTCNFIRDGQDLRYSNFAQVPLFLVPLEEQQMIADYLDAKVNEIDTIIKEKQEMLAALAEYKKSMIYEYVTGKKEVPAVNDDVVVLFDPNVLVMGYIANTLGDEQEGRIQAQKIKYLLDNYCGLNPNIQYYRFKHGPYDMKLNSYFDSLVDQQWFKQEQNGAITLAAGTKHADFLRTFREQLGETGTIIDDLLGLLQSMNVMKRSRLERIATLYAVWNDFLLDGITPTDDQIIQEVLSNWTENKKNFKYETWQGSLNKMKKHGLIPKGTGLHTLPKPEKDGGEAE